VSVARKQFLPTPSPASYAEIHHTSITDHCLSHPIESAALVKEAEPIFLQTADELLTWEEASSTHH